MDQLVFHLAAELNSIRELMAVQCRKKLHKLPNEARHTISANILQPGRMDRRWTANEQLAMQSHWMRKMIKNALQDSSIVVLLSFLASSRSGRYFPKLKQNDEIEMNCTSRIAETGAWNVAGANSIQYVMSQKTKFIHIAPLRRSFRLQVGTQLFWKRTFRLGLPSAFSLYVCCRYIVPKPSMDGVCRSGYEYMPLNNASDDGLCNLFPSVPAQLQHFLSSQ